MLIAKGLPQTNILWTLLSDAQVVVSRKEGQGDKVTPLGWVVLDLRQAKLNHEYKKSAGGGVGGYLSRGQIPNAVFIVTLALIEATGTWVHRGHMFCFVLGLVTHVPVYRIKG